MQDYYLGAQAVTVQGSKGCFQLKVLSTSILQPYNYHQAPSGSVMSCIMRDGPPPHTALPFYIRIPKIIPTKCTKKRSRNLRCGQSLPLAGQMPDILLVYLIAERQSFFQMYKNKRVLYGTDIWHEMQRIIARCFFQSLILNLTKAAQFHGCQVSH